MFEVTDRVIKFFEYIYNRQLIWYKKEILKNLPPWTEDHILDTFMFCCAYRELDAGTRYLFSNFQGVKDQATILLNVVIYRVFNTVGFFDDVIDGIVDPQKFDRSEFELKLDQHRKTSGRGLFNNAYLICSLNINKHHRPGAKHVQMTFLFERLVEGMDIILEKLNGATSPDEAFNIIISLPNVGGFLGSQILDDLYLFDFFPQGYTDNDFCVMGGGAVWGVNLIAEPDKVDPRDYCRWLASIQPEMFKKLYLETGKDWMTIFYKKAISNVPYLSVMNIQHNLCEFRKYTRLAVGKGKKRYYRKKI